jgi:4-amino-4-deoxy-L-arabinose transferase-like glycosyltransferase
VRAVLGIAVVAFVVRALVGIAPELMAWSGRTPIAFSGPDSVSYLAPATSLAAGTGYLDLHGHPTAERPPGYPLFLAGIFVLSGGPSPLAARLAQAALGALAVVLVHSALAARFPSPLPGTAAWLVALDPVAIGQSPYLLREALLLVLVAAVFAAQVGLRGRWRILATGLGLAALAITHQLYVLLGPALAVVDLWRVRRRGPRVWGWRLAAWALAGALVLVPLVAWARRTERATGRFAVVLAENAVPARELWLTVTCPNRWLNGDLATGFQHMAWEEERQLMAERGLEGTKAELYRRAGEAWREHPLRSLGRVLLMNWWYWAELPGAIMLVDRLPAARVAILPFHWARLVAAAAGLLLVLRGRQAPALRTVAAGGLLFFALAPAMLYPIPRYLAPAAPLLDALAAVGLLDALSARAAALAKAKP